MHKQLPLPAVTILAAWQLVDLGPTMWSKINSGRNKYFFGRRTCFILPPLVIIIKLYLCNKNTNWSKHKVLELKYFFKLSSNSTVSRGFPFFRNTAGHFYKISKYVSDIYQFQFVNPDVRYFGH